MLTKSIDSTIASSLATLKRSQELLKSMASRGYFDFPQWPLGKQEVREAPAGFEKIDDANES